MDLLSQSLLLAAIKSNNQQILKNTTKSNLDEKKTKSTNTAIQFLNSTDQKASVLPFIRLKCSNTDTINESAQNININTPILLPVGYHSHNEHSLVQVSYF